MGADPFNVMFFRILLKNSLNMLKFFFQSIEKKKRPLWLRLLVVVASFFLFIVICFCFLVLIARMTLDNLHFDKELLLEPFEHAQIGEIKIGGMFNDIDYIYVCAGKDEEAYISNEDVMELIREYEPIIAGIIGSDRIFTDSMYVSMKNGLEKSKKFQSPRKKKLDLI